MAQLFRIAQVAQPHKNIHNKEMWIVSEALFWDHVREQVQKLYNYTEDKLEWCMQRVKQILSQNTEQNAKNEIVIKGTLFQIIGAKGS